MKSNLTKTVLEWMLVTSLVLSGYFFVTFYFRSSQLREFGSAMARKKEVENYINALLPDVLEYSKRDRSIVPLLQSLQHPAIDGYLQANGLVKPAASAPTTKPAPR